MRTLMLMLFAVFVVFGSSAPLSTGARAGPSADVARRCMQYSYIAYPYKRPGSPGLLSGLDGKRRQHPRTRSGKVVDMTLM